MHTRQVFVRKPDPDKALQLKWKTFRNKLQPGTKETWTLSILRPDGKPADAQLLATMYDASLDQLMPHSWYFRLNFPRKFPSAHWRATSGQDIYKNFTFPIKTLKCNPLAYSTLENPYMRVGFGMLEVVGFASRKSMSNASFEEAFETSDDEFGIAFCKIETDDEKVQLRTNFAETAFFYPHLHTDANGEVSIKFTLPESLTEWKFRGLAHTKEMDYGSL